MKYVLNLVLYLSFFMIAGCGGSRTEDLSFPELTGEYLGQNNPGMTARLFAPGLVSSPWTERDAALSPDGNDFFYSLKGPEKYSIIRVQRENNRWQAPEVASFSGHPGYNDIEPCFSPDGNRLYFVSDRPVEGTGDAKDYDIWYVQRIPEGWSEPQNLGAPVNTPANEFYPSFTRTNILCFTAEYESSIGGEDIWESQFADGKFLPPVNLGDSINTKGGEFNSFIAPDGSFLIFGSTGWGKGLGSGDLWISFRKTDGSWTRARNMGPKVNSSSFEYCPSLTPDGKFLFFTSNRPPRSADANERLTYQDISARLDSPFNGSQNIFWIDAAVINELKPDQL